MAKKKTSKWYMKLLELLKQRRLWAAVFGVVAVIAAHFGLPLGEGFIDMLISTFSGGFAAILAAWSYVKPKE